MGLKLTSKGGHMDDQQQFLKYLSELVEQVKNSPDPSIGYQANLSADRAFEMYDLPEHYARRTDESTSQLLKRLTDNGQS